MSELRDAVERFLDLYVDSCIIERRGIPALRDELLALLAANGVVRLAENQSTGGVPMDARLAGFQRVRPLVEG